MVKLFYQEFQPHRALKRYVNCYWVLESTVKQGVEGAQQFLSDGGMELSFNLADPFEYGIDSSAPLTFENSCAVGVQTKQLRVNPLGRSSHFGVRFYPGGAAPFFPMPAVELRDRSRPEVVLRPA